MEDLIKDLDLKSKAILDFLKQEFSSIRTNRPTPQLIEDIEVNYLDQLLKVKQLGSISVLPPRELQVSVWDKNSVAAVAKAIQDSPLKLSPSVEGNVIRLRLPPLTEERRQELVKVVKSGTEKSRIKLRNLRDEINKKIAQAESAKLISEDKKFKLKKQVDESVSRINKEIESLLSDKIKEISE